MDELFEQRCLSCDCYGEEGCNDCIKKAEKKVINRNHPKYNNSVIDVTAKIIESWQEPVTDIPAYVIH